MTFKFMDLAIPKTINHINIFLNFLISSHPLSTGDTERRKLLVVFLLMTIPADIIFGILHLINGSYVVAGLDLSLALILTLIVILFRRFENVTPIYRVVIFLYSLILFYYIISATAHGYGSTWSLLYPLFAFFLLGKKEGLLWTSLFMLIMIALLINPGAFLSNYIYSSQFTSRFIPTYVMIVIFTYSYEAARQKYKLAMEAEQDKLFLEKGKLSQAKEETERTNRLLKEEMAMKEQIEIELRRHRDHLEDIVAERTFEIQKNSEKLKESEDRYRSLVENASDMVYQTDSAGHFTFVNQAALRQGGYTEDEIIGKAFYSLIRSDMRKDAIRFFVHQFEKGIQNTYIEYPVLVKDGQEVWIGQNTQLVIEDGQMKGFQAVSRDITDRKRAEKDLEEILKSLRKAFSTIVQVMVSAIETRDPYTAGHQKRSADLACAIATELGFPQEKIDGLHMAGIIHDIGKISIPVEILAKPTRLTDIEFSLIQEHPEKGYQILKDVESPWPLAEIVYQHHERMDGSGYPRSLKGDNILMEARIMAVADVVEAMATHRPYRPGLGIDVALGEIEDKKGTHYDNNVVDACLRLFREKGYRLEVA